MPEAEQGLNVARIASLRAGVPVSASAVTVNRFCASGLQAIAGAAERILARWRGGRHRRRHRVDEPDPDGRPQGRAEPQVGRRLSRRLSDDRSRRRNSRARGAAFRARSRTRLRSAATSARSRPSTPAGSTTRSWRCPRRTRTVARSRWPGTRDRGATPRSSALARLRPAFHVKGTVTAGNSSQTSDGASVAIVMDHDRARELGLTPLAPVRHLRHGGGGARALRHRSGAGRPQGAAAGGPHARRHGPRRAERGLRGAGHWPACASCRSIPIGSTSTAAPSRSATRSAAPARASPPRCSTSCAVVGAVMAWSRCASAAAWARRGSSRGWMTERRDSGTRVTGLGAVERSGRSALWRWALSGDTDVASASDDEANR